MSEEERPEAIAPKFDWIASADPGGLFETYSNYLHLTWTRFDVRLLFGLLRPRLGESNGFVVEERAGVTLGFHQIKNLHSMLGGWLESYEKTNGELQDVKLTPRPGELE